MDFIDYMLNERLIATHDETKKYISPLNNPPKPSSYSLMCFQTGQSNLRKDWRFGVYDYFPKNYIAYFRMNPTAREDYIEARSNYRMMLCGTTPLGIETYNYHPKVYDAFVDFNAAYAEDINRFNEWLDQYDEYLDDWSSKKKMFPPEYISYFTGNPQAMALWIAGVVTQKQIQKKERPSVMLGDGSGNPIKYGTPLAIFKDKYESIAIRHYKTVESVEARNKAKEVFRNNNRRKEIDNIISALEEIQNRIETVRDEEQEAIDNIPESLEGSDRYQTMEEAVESLDQAIESVEEVISDLKSAKG